VAINIHSRSIFGRNDNTGCQIYAARGIQAGVTQAGGCFKRFSGIVIPRTQKGRNRQKVGEKMDTSASEDWYENNQSTQKYAALEAGMAVLLDNKQYLHFNF
jgi:hypothetical protein